VGVLFGGGTSADDGQTDRLHDDLFIIPQKHSTSPGPFMCNARGKGPTRLRSVLIEDSLRDSREPNWDLIRANNHLAGRPVR
jgi:hypothetical protein